MNRQQYRDCISRAATSFANLSNAYQQAGDELLSRLEDILFSPTTIVCAGCRTGRLIGALKRQYPAARIIGCDESQLMLTEVKDSDCERVACDLDHLPLEDASADLFIMCLPASLYDYDLLFEEIKRIMKPEGLLMFAVLGNYSFRKLDDRDFKFGNAVESLKTFEMHNLGDLLLSKGFSAPVVDLENSTLVHDTQHGFIQEVRNTGWFDAFESAGDLSPNQVDEQDKSTHEVFRTNLEFIFGIAWITGDTARPLRVDFEQ